VTSLVRDYNLSRNVENFSSSPVFHDRNKLSIFFRRDDVAPWIYLARNTRTKDLTGRLYWIACLGVSFLSADSFYSGRRRRDSVSAASIVAPLAAAATRSFPSTFARTSILSGELHFCPVSRFNFLMETMPSHARLSITKNREGSREEWHDKIWNFLFTLFPFLWKLYSALFRRNCV